MNSPQFSHPDAARSRLRTIVADVEGEVARLSGPATTDDGAKPTDGLRASWDRLVEHLALGPEPEVRTCPVCQHVGMRAATVCGYCWTPLTPPTEHPGS